MLAKSIPDKKFLMLVPTEKRKEEILKVLKKYKIKNTDVKVVKNERTDDSAAISAISRGSERESS